jgi:hypothetical protein
VVDGEAAQPRNNLTMGTVNQEAAEIIANSMQRAKKIIWEIFLKITNAVNLEERFPEYL